MLEATAYICWILAGLTFMYVLCILSRIKIAIGILKAATEFTKDYIFAIFVPLVIFFFYMGFLFLWIYGLLYIYSAGTPREVITFPYDGIVVDATLRNSGIYYLIGLIWISEWFGAYSFFVIACMACVWYF